MKKIILSLLLSMASVSCAAENFTFAWDEAVFNSTSGDPNQGYDTHKFFYEMRFKQNNNDWIYQVTEPSVLTLSQSFNIVARRSINNSD